jgi:Mg2+/Co2+ transporter CorB
MLGSSAAWLTPIAVVVLLGVSAFFSSAEIALFSSTTGGADVDDADRRSRTLARLRADPHRLLVTILVGNNVVNVAIASIVSVALANQFAGEIAVTAATLATSVLVLVFGEIVPKAYGLGRANDWALTVARPVAVVEVLLSPIVTVFDVVTRRLSALLGGEPAIERPYEDD